MAEEFQESEILFRERFEDEGGNNFAGDECPPKSGRKTRKVVAKNKEKPLSINIPDFNRGSRNTRLGLNSGGGGKDGELVPPHVIVGRRVAVKLMTFSVCTGYGRNLKGRNLRECRNSILRLTGFLES